MMKKYQKPSSKDLGSLKQAEGVCNAFGSIAKGLSGSDCIVYGGVARGSMCFANGDVVTLACSLGGQPGMDCFTGGTDTQ
jgi:hypothetical protein